FGDELAGGEDVRTALEDQVDRAEPGHRLRPDLIEPRDSVEQVLFEWNRDQLLDLGCGKSQRLGLDLDLWRRELRQDVDGRVPDLGDAEPQHEHGGTDDQHAELQAEEDEPTNHRNPPEW